jgi:hypothetical protein
MTLDPWPLVLQQRLRHLVDSYTLAGTDPQGKLVFHHRLERLVHEYSRAMVELAIAETLLEGWQEVPLVRGMPFLSQVHGRLRAWQMEGCRPYLTPGQFQSITGLDALLSFSCLLSENPRTAAQPGDYSL